MVFFFGFNNFAVFGRSGLLWEHALPDADPKDVVMFDLFHNGVLQCVAKRRELDEHSEPVFLTYAIDAAKKSITQWTESDL